jgi:hypothetical protein
MPTQSPPIALEAVLELDLGSPIGQCRAMPVRLGDGAPPAVLAVWCADFDVDPYVEMFFFPTDTLKMALFTLDGAVVWRRDLGPGVVPGLWFCPVFAFDLDGDGVDEVWFVNNVNVQHPLGLSGYRLERLDAATGETTGQWPWPANAGGSLSHTFRNFIAGGRVRGEPVLVTAQGTYGRMALQGWNADVTERWQFEVPASAPGARGSHMCPITDLDRDGAEEIMWGERCVELDAGRELFCADRDTWRGHSDVIAPLLDRETGEWFFFTCREGDGSVAPRVALYDARGERLWGDIDQGHIDLGWVGHLGDAGEPVATAVRIGSKVCGPDGRYREGVEEFAYDAMTGEPVELPFASYGTLPVDLNGDGLHEIVRGRASSDGAVFDRTGREVETTGGPVALVSKFADLPGEQMLSYHEDGTLRVWADANAEDSDLALARYAHPFYAANRRLGATGYNLPVLGGL